MIDYAILLAVLIQVESSGNNTAVGDNGKSVGCLQIQQGVIDDVNKRSIQKIIGIIDKVQKIFVVCMYRIGLKKQYKQNKVRYTTLMKWLVESGTVDLGDTKKNQQKSTGKKSNVKEGN